MQSRLRCSKKLAKRSDLPMDNGELLAAEIFEAIRSGRDLWLYDQFVGGPDHLERTRQLLVERRAACSDSDETAFLTSVIQGLEKCE
jgi:hypothetical protein